MILLQLKLTFKQKRNQKQKKLDDTELLVENRESSSSIPDSVASIFFYYRWQFFPGSEKFVANFGDPEQERETPTQNQYINRTKLKVAR